MARKPQKPRRARKVIRHKQTRLPTVRSWPRENATILDIKYPGPLFLGDDREDLLCSACRAPIALGVSMPTLRGLFDAPVQLLVKCPKCRSLSLLD